MVTGEPVLKLYPPSKSWLFCGQKMKIPHMNSCYCLLLSFEKKIRPKLRVLGGGKELLNRPRPIDCELRWGIRTAGADFPNEFAHLVCRKAPIFLFVLDVLCSHDLHPSRTLQPDFCDRGVIFRATRWPILFIHFSFSFKITFMIYHLHIQHIVRLHILILF